jgi:hypothetical protein
MCDSQEAHDAALAADEAYFRRLYDARPVYAHVCSGPRLRCTDCGAQFTGDALDDSIANMEASNA